MSSVVRAYWLNMNPEFMTVVWNSVDENGEIGRFRSDISGIAGETWKKNFKDNDHKGVMSQKAKMRVVKCVNWINQLTDFRKVEIDGVKVKYKLTFITLTLPSKQIHTDQEIKRNCLNQFLTELRDKYGMQLYIWRAEPQKNGNIHFHICCDVGIHYNMIRDTWNRIVNKMGYVDRSRSKNPNSTDIHALKRIRDIRKYVTKYITKENDGRKIEGRQWFICRELSEIKDNQAYWSEADKDLYRIEKTEGEKVVKMDYCTVIRMSIKELRFKGYHSIVELFDDYIFMKKLQIYEGVSPPEVEKKKKENDRIETSVLCGQSSPLYEQAVLF